MADENDLISFDALYDSMMRCKKGVMWKDSTAHYVLNGAEETTKLVRQLKTGAYRPRPPLEFTVTHPKVRQIKSICFRDRVYQRSINDNELYPAMTRSFIRDNCACQLGRGTDDARARLKCHMQREWRRTGTSAWVLQCDVHHYYQTMRHDVVMDIFRRRVRPQTYQRIKRILTEQYAGDVGFSPGSQMVQIAGISALDGMDHYIKERLHVKGYIRYMDDFILIHPDREYLEQCQEEIARILREIGFELHPDKTRIYPISDGIEFLGFNFRLTETGKVLMLIKSENVRAERRKLRRMAGLVRKGRITRQKADECYASWVAHARKGNSYNLVKRMDQYYMHLYKEDQDGSCQKDRRPAGEKDQ